MTMRDDLFDGRWRDDRCRFACQGRWQNALPRRHCAPADADFAATGGAGADRDGLQRALRRAERELEQREYDECLEIVQAVVATDDGDDDEGGVETEDIFGFTSDAYVLERGRFELSAEAAGAFCRRFVRHRAGNLSGTFAFPPIERFSVEAGRSASRFSIRDVPGLDNRNAGGFSGAFAEFQWNILKRAPSSPLGLMLSVEPGIGFLDEEGGRNRNGPGPDCVIRGYGPAVALHRLGARA
jgi:hypothetical protein